MQQTRKRRFLIAFCSLLFACIMGIAVAQVIPARADELVLSGNTAEYTFTNDMTEVYATRDTRYLYNRATNEWTSTQIKNYKTLTTKLTLTVTDISKGSSLAFYWKVSNQYSTSFVVTKNSGGDSSEILSVKDSADFKSHLQYGDPVQVDDLKVGDIVEIAFCGKDRNEYYTVIKGLQVPNTEFSITAKIAEDSIGHGKMQTEKSEETFDTEQNQIVAKRGYDESVTFTALPQEGYTAYWLNSNGGIASHVAELTISGISETNADTEYTLRFIKLDENGLAISFDAMVEDSLGWANEDGKYKAQNVDGIDYRTPSATLTVIAKGDAYLKFTYAFSSDPAGLTGGNPNLRMTCNGRQDPVVGSTLPTTYVLGTELKEMTGYVHLSKEGLNVVDIELAGSGAIGKVAPDGTTVYFKVFEVVTEDELPEKQIHFHYNPNYADLTINGDLVQKSAEGIVDYVFTTKLGKPLDYKIVAKSGVISSIDGETTVKTEFVALNTNTDYDYWRETEEDIGFFTEGLVSNGGTKLVVNEDETARDKDLHLRFEYQEYAPKPTLTASKTADGSVSEITIEDGSTVEFPYNKDNAIIVRIYNFEKLTRDEITVKIDGQVLPTNQITGYSDYFGFVVDDVRQKNIEISYQKEGYICTENTLSFKLREVYQGDINDLVKVGNIRIEDVKASQYLELTPYVFSPTYSEGDNIAFLAGNSMYETGESYNFGEGGGASVLGFTLSETEAGVLSFEYQIKGVYENFYGAVVSRTQAWYRFTNKFSENEISLVSNDGEQRDGNIVWEQETSLLAKAVTDGGGKIEYGETSKPVGKTAWYRVSIKVPQEKVLDTVYLLFYARSLSDKSTQSLAIRNVNYISGTATANIKIVDGGKGSVETTLNGEESKTATTGTTITYSPAIGDTISLKASAEGATFYGWTVNGEWLSEQEELNYIVDSAETEIIAYIMPKGYYEARHGGTFYRKLVGTDGALGQVKEGEIVITSNDIQIAQSIEIPAGISLILPYSAAGEYTRLGNAEISAKQISWATKELETKNKYFSLKIEDKVTVTIKGGLYVGGVLNYPSTGYQGYTSGAYSHLVNNGTINVEDGGVLDVYGRVTGTGNIDVKSGAKLYEPFLILDFAGGENTLNTFSANVTPFKRYAMINIENPFTIHFGGQLIGHATLYALEMFVSLDQPFIGDSSGDGRGHDTMIMLLEGASVKAEYDPNTVVEGNLGNCTELIGRTKLTFTGGAKFSYMLFSAMGFEVPTTGVYFSIPYNFDLNLTGGDYETVTDFMIMPGATVTVAQGAKLTLKANAWVYDGLQAGDQAGKSYPSAEKLAAKGLSKSGNLIVDGTLVMAKKNQFTSSGELTGNMQPITFLGIIQTSGKTGRIEIGEGVTLKGKIVDGLKDKNYFAYTTTARVWDKAHNCFGNLEAGKQYTATSGDGFTLEALNYTNTEKGAEATELKLNQTMKGSWMIEHEEDVYDWAPKAGEGDDLSDRNKVVEITRQCTQLGCDHSVKKHLFYGANDIGSYEFKNDKFTEEDLKALFKNYFGELPETVKIESVRLDNAGNKDVATYHVTVHLSENGVWLADGQYVNERTFAWSVTAFDLNTLVQDAFRLSGENPTYCYKAQTPGFTITVTNKDGKEFTLSYYGSTGNFEELATVAYDNNTDAGAAKVTLTPKNENFTGVGNFTFEIRKAKITVKAANKLSPKGEDQVPLTYTVDGATYEDGNNIHSEGAFALAVTNFNKSGTGTYTITVAWAEGFENAAPANKNYEIEFVEGVYTVTIEAFGGAVFGDGSLPYDGDAHGLAVSGLQDGENGKYTYVYEYYAGEEAVGDPLGEEPVNAGTYTVKATITFTTADGVYTQTITAKLTIEKKQITVEIEDVEETYGHEYQAEDLKWHYAAGSAPVKEEQLHMTLALKDQQAGSRLKAGDYAIEGSCSEANYAVTFSGSYGEQGKYTVKKKAITITLQAQSSVYNNAVPEVGQAKDTAWKVTVGEILSGDELSVQLYLEAPGKDVKADGYTIKGRYSNDNYDVTFVDGTYTITARPVTVKIADQEAVYDYAHKYAFNNDAWTYEGTLAGSETRADLKITLSTETLTDAGSYKITGTCANGNYAVTFTGSYTKQEDAASGHAGVYTVKQKDVGDGTEDAAVFLLLVGEGGNTSEGERKLRVKLTGESLNVTCTVKVYEGTDEKTLNCKIDPAELKTLGEQTVTVTIEDQNYKGSAVFTVVVTDAEGYTPEMREKLQQLKTLAAGMDAEALKAEDFQKLKEINALLSALSEEEREALGESLEPYDELVAAWHELADLDEIIETAEAIGNAPIRGLYEAAAVVSALAVLGYIVMKGGLL